MVGEDDEDKGDTDCGGEDGGEEAADGEMDRVEDVDDEGGQDVNRVTEADHGEDEGKDDLKDFAGAFGHRGEVVTSIGVVIDHDEICSSGDDECRDEYCVSIGAGTPSHDDTWEEACPDSRAGDGKECAEENASEDQLENVFEEGEV